MTQARVKFLGLDLDFSIEKARRELGYQPATPFDEGMRMYVEDIDLAYRAAQAGWERWYVPAARVVHAYDAAIDRAFFMANNPLAGAAYGVASLANASPGARDAALAAGGTLDAVMQGAAPRGAPIRGRPSPPRPRPRS